MLSSTLSGIVAPSTSITGVAVCGFAPRGKDADVEAAGTGLHLDDLLRLEGRDGRGRGNGLSGDARVHVHGQRRECRE